MERTSPNGIHHVTAVALDPQRNVDFYREVLGLRLVKQTVNFDAPDSYHLYYGDDEGRPGTLLTFFGWPDVGSGRRGTGQATATAFSIPEGSLDWWRARLDSLGVEVVSQGSRFGSDYVAIEDPDGLLIELMTADGDGRSGWRGGPVPKDHAVRGLHSVTLTERDSGGTHQLMSDRLGWTRTVEDGARSRYQLGDGGAGATVDVVVDSAAPRGLVAGGTVHHVAYRVADDDAQQAWRDHLLSSQVEVTAVFDRKYFHSIYFREPGGVLFEIATEGPGFLIDESPEALGLGLSLPPWLEERRSDIEARLTPLVLSDLKPAGATDKAR